MIEAIELKKKFLLDLEKEGFLLDLEKEGVIKTSPYITYRFILKNHKPTLIIGLFTFSYNDKPHNCFFLKN